MKWINFLFPPLCRSCGEKCETKVFCRNCWLLCEPPDPAVRCRLCFEEIDEKEKVCTSCRVKRRLSIPRAYVFDPESPAHLLGKEAVDALASFAVLQWIQLEWEMPDAIIPMPDSISIASAFAHLLERPLIQALSPIHEYKEGRLSENQTLVLFDVSNSIPKVQKAAISLLNSFPKKVYHLSLFSC